jgi:hypothetical protein
MAMPVLLAGRMVAADSLLPPLLNLPLPMLQVLVCSGQLPLDMDMGLNLDLELI